MLKSTIKKARTWTELETFATSLGGWSDDSLTRETGATNARSTFRRFDAADLKPEDATVVLYRDTHAWCPYCQKVWLWLEEKRVPYRIEKVTMFCYGEKERWYKRIVPSGMLPALELNGQIITESDDILMALESEFGALGPGMTDAQVVPLRRMERQLFRAWCQWLCYPSRSSRDELRNQEMFESMAKVVDDTLGASKGGPYFLGSELCTADVIFTPYIERMAASLYYYKGYDIKQQNPNISDWFAAMETRSTYLGTQSDFHTHVHDLPPQMGGCYSSGTPSAEECAASVDAGTGVIPEVSHAEPETALQESMLRMIKHKDTVIEINPLRQKDQLDEALRCVLTSMATGEDCPPPAGTDHALRYIRDRISVPRDMSLFAGRKLRAAFEMTAGLDGERQGPKIPFKHRRDQDVVPFREAREVRRGGGGRGSSSGAKTCGAM
jgi:glutathione S-transferase